MIFGSPIPYGLELQVSLGQALLAFWTVPAIGAVMHLPSSRLALQALKLSL
jgi:hypothetical protein